MISTAQWSEKNTTCHVMIRVMKDILLSTTTCSVSRNKGVEVYHVGPQQQGRTATAEHHTQCVGGGDDPLHCLGVRTPT
eukprot:m.371946 g.371946  ORF g.371946 m.371946 type:complete len:79 (-) comp28137_c0_seq3:62-298(-)